MPLQWRNQFWQSLEEGAGKRCLECDVRHKRSVLAMFEEQMREAARQAVVGPAVRLDCIFSTVESAILTVTDTKLGIYNNSQKHKRNASRTYRV